MDINLKSGRNVSIENLMKTVKQISSWERLSGSEDEYAAFEYLEGILSSLGYKTDLVKHDAFISLPVYSRLFVNGEEVYSQTHSMALSTDENGISAEIVYIQNPMENLTEETCRGKIVMMDGRANFPPINKAYGLGAKGIICIQEGVIRECIISSAWGSPTAKTKSLIPRIPVVSISDVNGDKIKKLIKNASAKATMITRVDSGWRRIPSLTAVIKAPKETDKFVMFTGHLDSWYFGAIDNGTVNAAQVEIARIVADNRDKLLRNFKVVFFSGHSHGRYAGSAWYADQHWEDLHKNCVINVNADSIGGKGAVDITRSIIMPEAKDIAVKIIKEITGVDFVGRRCEKLADQSFWNAGVSSAFASFSKQPLFLQPDGTKKVEKGNAELGWWWHTPGDTVDNIDPDYLLRDTKIFVEYIMSFLTNEIIPLNFVRTAEEIRAYLYMWANKAGKSFELSSSLKKADQLEECCVNMYEAKKTDSDKFNNTIMKLGRFLVPLNFTTGNIYENDPAEALPPVPSLELISRLAEVEENSDEAMEIKVELRHKRNFVDDSLNKAIELICEYLAGM